MQSGTSKSSNAFYLSASIKKHQIEEGQHAQDGHKGHDSEK
jgi:hypothetical protein